MGFSSSLIVSSVILYRLGALIAENDLVPTLKLQFKCLFAQAILIFCFLVTFDFLLALHPLNPNLNQRVRTVDRASFTPLL